VRLTEEQWQQIIADRNQKRQRESASFQAAHPLPEVAKKSKQRGVKGVIRQSSRQPNKTEIRFENDYLKGWLAGRAITSYDYEAITLKIANGCRYTPDWYVEANADGYFFSEPSICFFEIKARNMIWDDAIVKLKVAASKYPRFTFYLCAYDGKTGWTIEKVLP